MNRHKAAAAVAAVMLAAAALPALNWAQGVYAPPGTRSEELDARMREQQKAIREAAEHARMQAGQAQAAMIQAAKSPYRSFKTMFGRGAVSAPLEIKIREASAAVRDAKDDESREKAAKELASALDEYFEEDMKVRGKELDDIRARLAKLEAQLDRRREKKEEIIDLQMKVALNEADGLGFYSGPQDKMFNFPLAPPPVYGWRGGPGDGAILSSDQIPQERMMTTWPPAPSLPPVPTAAPDPEPKSR